MPDRAEAELLAVAKLDDEIQAISAGLANAQSLRDAALHAATEARSTVLTLRSALRGAQRDREKTARAARAVRGCGIRSDADRPHRIVISARVDQEDRALIEAAAAQEGLSLAAFVERVIVSVAHERVKTMLQD